jgi:hypothetical protein
MAAIINDKVTAGPAACPAAAAVRTNNPAPIIAPTPSAIKLPAPKVRFKPFPPSSAWANMAARSFFLNKLIVLFL